MHQVYRALTTLENVVNNDFFNLKELKNVKFIYYYLYVHKYIYGWINSCRGTKQYFPLGFIHWM